MDFEARRRLYLDRIEAGLQAALAGRRVDRGVACLARLATPVWVHVYVDAAPHKDDRRRQRIVHLVDPLQRRRLAAERQIEPAAPTLFHKVSQLENTT